MNLTLKSNRNKLTYSRFEQSIFSQLFYYCKNSVFYFFKLLGFWLTIEIIIKNCILSAFNCHIWYIQQFCWQINLFDFIIYKFIIIWILFIFCCVCILLLCVQKLPFQLDVDDFFYGYKLECDVNEFFIIIISIRSLLIRTVRFLEKHFLVDCWLD